MSQKYSFKLRYGALVTTVFSALLVSACSMDTPTQMSKAPIVVSKEREVASYDASKVDKAVLMNVQDHYLKQGDGPVSVLVTYDPRSKSNTAMSASNNAGQIAASLKKMGATDVQTEILPVMNSGDVSKVEFTYDIYKAHAPDNCSYMGGVEDSGTGINDQYMFGCSHDMLLARQISNPQDLLGRTASVPASAQRQVNWIPSYNDGSPSDNLESISTTD